MTELGQIFEECFLLILTRYMQSLAVASFTKGLRLSSDLGYQGQAHVSLLCWPCGGVRKAKSKLIK